MLQLHHQVCDTPYVFRKRTINFSQYLKFLENLAEQKQIDLRDLKEKLADCGLPGSTNVLNSLLHNWTWSKIVFLLQQGENKANAVGLPSAT